MTPASSRPRPRTKPPAERRDDLMNSAERLFLDQGVASTTIEQITSGAEVAKGTFYLYFSSKEDVLEALRERFVEGLLDHTKAAVAKRSKEGWSEKLAAWAKACAMGYMDAVRLHDIVFFENHPPTREGLTNNVLIDHLTELLAAGARAHVWSIEDPRFTAVFLFNALHGVVDETMNNKKRINRARLMRRLEEHCFRTVGLPVLGSSDAENQLKR